MAGLTTTQTFNDGDTVTAAKLNNIISDATIDANAVTTVKINANAVTDDKLADNSVDSNAIKPNVVINSKLQEVAAKTVKANATDATANPTDVPVAANQLLVGTSTTIKAVSFSDDLALDNAGATASKIIAAPSLINGKSTVAASNLDELLIYDQDATTVLKKTTAGSIVASLKATDSQSGSAELATTAELIGGTASPTNLVAGNVNVAPMMAKAWVEFTSSGSGAQTITNSFNITSLTKNGTGIYDIVFDTDLPSNKYILTGMAWIDAPADEDYQLQVRIQTSPARTGAGCTVLFGNQNDFRVPLDPTGSASLVFYGLTS